ncbi:uncharacterized protein UDID_17276 [Ustilago sp. UG-2017a]|nr:uncharacterized protein UDID_17276 [Ustilago sp. UG-2017a]
MSTTVPGGICDPPFTCTDLTEICHRANPTAGLSELCRKPNNLPDPLIPVLPSYESTGLPASCAFRPMTRLSRSLEWKAVVHCSPGSLNQSVNTLDARVKATSLAPDLGVTLDKVTIRL